MKRILVVEDEASIRELVALNLKMTGWEVLEAPSAETCAGVDPEKSPLRCSAAGYHAAGHGWVFAVRNHPPR